MSALVETWFLGDLLGIALGWLPLLSLSLLVFAAPVLSLTLEWLLALVIDDVVVLSD